MPVVVTADQDVRVGVPGHVQGDAPAGNYSAVFEDDGDTGYFYALDHGCGEATVRDALHIYDAAHVSDKHLPCKVRIGWSSDNTKVVLMINGHPHAVFDFTAKRGFCRSGFPPPVVESGWTGHGWSDTCLEVFA